MRKRARRSAKRFTEEEFAKGWVMQMEKLVILRNWMTRSKDDERRDKNK